MSYKRQFSRRPLSPCDLDEGKLAEPTLHHVLNVLLPPPAALGPQHDGDGHLPVRQDDLPSGPAPSQCEVEDLEGDMVALGEEVGERGVLVLLLHPLPQADGAVVGRKEGSSTSTDFLKANFFVRPIFLFKSFAQTKWAKKNIKF